MDLLSLTCWKGNIMRYIFSFFSVLILLCVSVSHVRAQQTGGAPTLIIRGGTLIDGTGAPPRENGTIAVRGNKILSVIREANLPIPEGVRVVDAQGKYVLPGLIDGHVHFDPYAAPLYLYFGITSVVDTGNTAPWIFVQKFATERGLVSGPRIYAVGPHINSPPKIFSSILVNTTDEARAAVRLIVEQGSDAIKVYKQLRPDLMRAVIEEAHFHGIPVTGHIAISARDAVMMGLDSLEHATGISIATMTDKEKLKEIEGKRYTDKDYLVDHATLPETFYFMKPELFSDLIKLFVEKGTFVTPTLICYWMGTTGLEAGFEKEDRTLLSDPAYAFVPQLDRRWILRAYEHFGRIKAGPKFQQGYKNVQSFLKQFAQAGGKIVAGSDASGYGMHAVSLHRELELLVNAGLTPAQALLGVTRNAAEKVRKWKEVGSVEPGKYADFVILNANPLEDIRNTRNIHIVIQNGKILDTKLGGNFTPPLLRPPSTEQDLASYEKLLFGN